MNFSLNILPLVCMWRTSFVFTLVLQTSLPIVLVLLL